MDFTGHKKKRIAGPDSMFALPITFHNTLPVEEIHFMLFFVVVKRGMATRGDLHEPHGISWAVVVCGKKEPGLHAGKTGFIHWYSGDIRCVFDEHSKMYSREEKKLMVPFRPCSEMF